MFSLFLEVLLGGEDTIIKAIIDILKQGLITFFFLNVNSNFHFINDVVRT